MRSIALRVGIIALIAMGSAGCGLLGGSANYLAVGDCFDPPADVEGTVTDVEKHSCIEAHGGEVMFVGDFAPATDTYPITSAFQDFYSTTCTPAFNTYTGLDFDSDTTYSMAAFKPTTEGWSGGDRKMICYAVRIDNATMNASIKKS